MFYFIIKNLLVHTPRRLFTTFNMITICDITVTQRLTALSKRRIKTRGVTIFSIESNFTSYVYKYLYLIYTDAWQLFDGLHFTKKHIQLWSFLLRVFNRKYTYTLILIPFVPFTARLSIYSTKNYIIHEFSVE